MDRQTTLQTQLLDFLAQHADVPGTLDAQTDLLQSGTVDSLLVMDLLAHIESTYNVVLGASEVTPDNFRSVGQLARVIVEKQNYSARAA